MSTVTVTPLVPGATATSTDVNATLNSFNTGTAAGALVQSNTRVEGIDRRTMSATQHVVGTNEYGNNTTVYVNDTGPIRSVGAYAEVTGLITPALTVTLPTRFLLHATVEVYGATATFASGVRLRVQMRLEESTDGVTWSALPYTYRSVRFKSLNVGVYVLLEPAIRRSVSWTTYVLPAGAARYYRVAFQTTQAGDVAGGTDPSFKGCSIFIESYGA